jgi:amidase
MLNEPHKMAMLQTPWQERVAKKRQECDNKIPPEWRIPKDILSSLKPPLAENKNDLIRKDAVRNSGVLTDREYDITEKYTVKELLAALASGALTSVEVTTAYCKRAAVAQQLV